YVTNWDTSRVTRILNEDELSDVLRKYKLTVPKPTLEDYGAAIEEHLDATAKSRGYKDADRIASYIASSNSTWAAEAAVFVQWRDAVWDTCYATLAQVQVGTPAPSVAVLI